MTPTLSPEFFQALVDFPDCKARVQARLDSLKSDAALLRLFVHYASWNSQFANGVAALTSLIGEQRQLFTEAGLPRAVADRSNLVASYFFDAARDEYDDHINPARDTHRCLVQACLLGMVDVLGLGIKILNEDENADLARINTAVQRGYTGDYVSGEGKLAQAFFGMGYHLGSELLAEREFSIIDSYLRAEHSDVVQQLMRKTITLAGTEHRCYAWVGVHSGLGGDVEADHFAYAIEGAQQGLKYIDPNSVAAAVSHLKSGFARFAQDHDDFFALSAYEASPAARVAR